MLGRAELCRVIRKAVLGLCYASGAFAKTESFKLGYLLFGIGHDGYSVAAVDFSDNGFDLLLERKLIFVGESEIALFLFAQADYFARERFTALAAFSPHGGEHGVDPELAAFCDDEIYLGVGVGRESVDRNDAGEFIDIFDVGNMAQEVRYTSFERADIFNRKLLNSVGFSMNIKNTSKILGHYIFLKDAQMNRNQPDRINALFYTFRKLNSVQLDFTSVLTMEGEFASEDVFIDTLGKYLISVPNSDYDWYVFFRMLFAIEPGNNINDFRMFLSVIKNYLVDDYWLNTSFVRLPMEDAKVLQRECLQMLADSLVHIGTIHILHDDKMSQLNRDFVLFVEELEQRTISYRDFMQYREAYHEEWLRRCALIFGRH